MPSLSLMPSLLMKDVVVEPLIRGWYAWSYLISPATAALYTSAQIKLLESFVASPAIHATSLKNPAMRGGPFVEIDPSHAPEMDDLLRQTRARAQIPLAFAEAIRALDKLLASEATGFSMADLYKRVPEPLRGYVELVYDINHHATARYLEPLLYGSNISNRASEELSLSRKPNSQRGFAFSTPRLEAPDQLRIPISFDHPGLDALYRARHTPASAGEVAEQLGLRGEAASHLGAFFGSHDPGPNAMYRDDAPRIRYFGHASLLFETRRLSILVDPVPLHGDDTNVNRFCDDDLPARIDYLLITHNHQDHCMLEALLELRHRVKTVVVPRSSGGTLPDPSLRLVLRRLGFIDVVELDSLDVLEVDGGVIQAVPFLGEHADLDVRTKTGYRVTLGGKTTLLLADSNNLEPRLYEHIAPSIGPVDVIFIGMECEGAPMSWLYGPLLLRPLSRKMDQTRRLSGSDKAAALDIVARFRPAQVYVYAMGLEPWLSHVMVISQDATARPMVESDGFIAACRAQGVTAERLYAKKELLLT